jgi:tetratricopeptide (TPR) repeat protein
MTAPIENNLQAQTVAPALNNAPVNTGIVQAPNHAPQAVNTLPANANPPAAFNSAAAAVQAVTPPSVPTPVAPALLGITVEDVVVPASASPAVFALSAQADASQKRGDLEGAVVITERALRIDSRNPIITYKLALLRLKQNKPQLAEDLAGKAALLAGSDLEMKRKSWLLIAEARQNQQNFQGAKDAKNKAESFFGR